MAAILKYKLEITDRQTFKFPSSSRVLSVQDQNGELFMWVFVNSPSDPAERVIRIVGTGNELPAIFLTYHNFIATVQQSDIGAVWHVFEELS